MTFEMSNDASAVMSTETYTDFVVDAPAKETKWYALQVRPRFEKIVAVHLQHKGFEDYLPLYRSRRKWSDRVKEIDLPLFPGYIFCKFDVLRRLPILMVPGVMSIVGLGRSPLAVSDDEIAAEFKIPKGQVLLRIPQLLAKIGVQERLEMVFYAYTDVGVYQQMSPQVQKHFNSPPIKQRAS